MSDEYGHAVKDKFWAKCQNSCRHVWEWDREELKQSFQTGEGLISVITLKTWVKERESPTSISISQQFWNRKQTCSIVRIYNFRANFMIMHPSTLKNTWGQSFKYRAEHETGEIHMDENCNFSMEDRYFSNKCCLKKQDIF